MARGGSGEGHAEGSPSRGGRRGGDDCWKGPLARDILHRLKEEGAGSTGVCQRTLAMGERPS